MALRCFILSSSFYVMRYFFGPRERKHVLTTKNHFLTKLSFAKITSHVYNTKRDKKYSESFQRQSIVTGPVNAYREDNNTR